MFTAGDKKRKRNDQKDTKLDIQNKRKKTKIAKKKIQDAKDKKFVPATYNDWSLADYKNITEGSILLGCIKEVTEYNLIVALPNRLLGYVSLRDLSSSYAKLLIQVSQAVLPPESVLMLQELYSPGEFIVVQIKSVVNNNGKVNVGLIIEPNKTNISLRGAPLSEGTILQCSVTSELENGFIMDTGLPTVRAAFLPLEFVTQTCAVGKVLLCFVTSTTSDKGTGLLTVKLSSQTEFLPTMSLNEDDSTFNSFYPGCAANVQIIKVADYGLRVKCGVTEGIINRQHLAAPFQDKTGYSVGQELRARVIYTTQMPNMVYFSAIPAICSLGTEDPSVQTLQTMKTIKGAKVYAVGSTEVYLSLGDGCLGVCSKREIKEGTKRAQLDVDDSRDCRVLRYWPMDDIYVVGMKESILQQKVYSLDSLAAGTDVKVTIIKVVSAGAVVMAGKTVKGFVPKIHLKKASSDKHEGELDARVLNVQRESKVFFTMRDDVINSQLDMVTGFDSDSIGAAVAGVVFDVKHNGLRVEFYDRAIGFLPTTNLPAGRRLGHYPVGSLVECKVELLWTNKSALLTMVELKYFILLIGASLSNL